MILPQEQFVQQDAFWTAFHCRIYPRSAPKPWGAVLLVHPSGQAAALLAFVSWHPTQLTRPLAMLIETSALNDNYKLTESGLSSRCGGRGIHAERKWAQSGS